VSGGDFWHDMLEHPIIWEADDVVEVKPAANPQEADALDAVRETEPAHHVDAAPEIEHEMQHDHALDGGIVHEAHGSATTYDGHADHAPITEHDDGAVADGSTSG
jgi:hypothetical protein